MRRALCWFALAALLPTIAMAETVKVPFGTTVYVELDQQVTSKKKETTKGDEVKAHVWKDVWVDDCLVIEAGTPVDVQVAAVKKARFAGLKGKLELEAIHLVAVDGHDLSLTGGYDGSGKGRMGLSVSLAAVVAWPLIFVKGKQAILDPGTVFDTTVRDTVEVEATMRREPVSEVDADLVVTVLYDEIPEKKVKILPLQLSARAGDLTEASIVTVNGAPITPVPIELATTAGDGTVRGEVKFKPFSKSLRRGMNLFEVSAGEATAEVFLEVEL